MNRDGEGEVLLLFGCDMNCCVGVFFFFVETSGVLWNSQEESIIGRVHT